MYNSQLCIHNWFHLYIDLGNGVGVGWRMKYNFTFLLNCQLFWKMQCPCSISLNYHLFLLYLICGFINIPWTNLCIKVYFIKISYLSLYFTFIFTSVYMSINSLPVCNSYLFFLKDVVSLLKILNFYLYF